MSTEVSAHKGAHAWAVQLDAERKAEVLCASLCDKHLNWLQNHPGYCAVDSGEELRSLPEL